jgi:L-threonylcarbamoyladenylate synthase
MSHASAILEAVLVLKQGGIIAYPTEAVFGLGCDPFNEAALTRLLTIKHRSPHKGLILIADCFERIKPLVGPVSDQQLQKALASWPGPYTWVFPAELSHTTPLIRGNNATIAVRVTAHPIASALCQAFGHPLVSTSANRSTEPPMRTAKAVTLHFGQEVDYVLEGKTSDLSSPTEIRDVLTGALLRTSTRTSSINPTH